MTIHILLNNDGPESLIVAAYLREELALAAREKLGVRSHTVEEIPVLDA